MSTCGLSPLLQRGFAYLKSDMELGHARDLDASGWDMSSEAMTCNRSPWSFPRFSHEGWRPRAWNPTPSSRMPWNETAASVIQDIPQRFRKIFAVFLVFQPTVRKFCSQAASSTFWIFLTFWIPVIAALLGNRTTITCS